MILLFILGGLLAQIFVRSAAVLLIANTITLILIALRLNYIEDKINANREDKHVENQR